MKVTFFDPRNAENKFALPINTLKLRFIDFFKIVF
jgi:hypothetical protein